MKKLNFKLLFIASLLTFFIVSNLCSASMHKVGHLANGPVFDLIEKNGYLYAAHGCEVRVYDVSSYSKIAQLTWRDYLSRIYVGYPIYGLYIESNYLYIASSNLLVISDISNPLAPSIVSYIDVIGTTRGTLRDVEVKGSYAFLSTSDIGIQVVDISNKASPSLIATVKLSGYNRPWRLTVSGNYLYVAMETDNRLDILDISNPANPRVVGSYSSGTGTNSFSGVAVKGSYAFVTEYHYGVRVIDISNPAAPFEVTNLMDMNANDIKILGDYAYVSVRYQGFNIIDISNPRSIAITGKGMDFAGYIEGIYPTANYTYLAGESKGFAIYSTINPSAPSLIVSVYTVGGVDSLIARDNLLYLGAHNDGVWIVDISDKANPKEIAFVLNKGRNEGMALKGNYLYVAGDWANSIIDVSNPLAPVLIKGFANYNIDDVFIDGDTLYVSIYYPMEGIGIYDITDPLNPVEISKLPLGRDLSFAKYGDYLLVTVRLGTNLGLHILDVRDRANPVLVSTFDAGKSYGGIGVIGNVAVALTGNDVVTIDISDPLNPKQLDRKSYPGVWMGYSLDIYNNLVYATSYLQTKKFDITNPSSIKEVESTSLGGDCIDYYQGYVYTGFKWGVYVFETELASLPSVEKGILRVTTRPIAGDIYVDNSFVGKGNIEIELAPGDYAVSYGDVSGFIKPNLQIVTIKAKQITEIEGIYTKITPTAFTYTLQKGWNLFSLAILNTSISAKNLARVVGESLQMVIAYEDGDFSKPFIVGFNDDIDNFDIRPDLGYYIYLTNDTTFSIYGTTPGQRNIYLKKGWNLIGWTSLNTTNASTLIEISENNMKYVAMRNETTGKYQTYIANLSREEDNFLIEPGNGYFVYVERNCTLSYDG